MGKKIGIALLVSGATVLIWISFAQPKKVKPVTTDPFKNPVVQKKETISWLPYFGTVLIAGGLILIVTDKKLR